MSHRRRLPGRILLAALLGACGGDSTGPATGALELAVSGLPGGAPASLLVTGPESYSRGLNAGGTLTGLQPGSYTVAASPVTVGEAVYAADPTSQTVTITEGNTTPSAVVYAEARGGLTVTIDGLPPNVEAAVTVTGPGDFVGRLTGSTTLGDLLPGIYTVAAQPVASDAARYAGSPATQQVHVAADAVASAAVSYAESAAEGLNFLVDGLYLTQSVQTYGGDVPLVAGRDALLRVFVTASQPGAESPDVRVRFFHGGTAVLERVITRTGPVPLAAQEGTLASTWNLPVPGSLVTADLSILVEVDPDDSQPETDESDNAFPASGNPLPLEVEGVAPFRVTLVPVTTSVDGRSGNVTAANRDRFLATAMRMHPLASSEAIVAPPFTVPASVGPLESDNDNNAWNEILSRLHAKRTAEGSGRYYYGLVSPTYSSGVAGIGYVGLPVAIGWDKLPSAASVAAHEWGHNWGRNHAPCGGASNHDRSYPYAGGIIGVVGYDIVGGSLKPRSSPDLMGYCDNEWISDYTYLGVMRYRRDEASWAGMVAAALQPTLVVWGRIENGRAVLEPAFQAITRPSLPERDGPYTLEARARDGGRLWSLSFSPEEVADDPNGGRHFAFAVPLSHERAARLDHLRLAGGGESVTSARAGHPTADVQVTWAGPGRVRLRWDATRAPMVVVRDPGSGEILAFAQGGDTEVAADRADLALTVSDRVGSRDVMVRVR